MASDFTTFFTSHHLVDPHLSFTIDGAGFLLPKVKYMERQMNEKGFTECVACINMPRDEYVAKATWSEQHSTNAWEELAALKK